MNTVYFVALADDILLLAPSVNVMQSLVNALKTGLFISSVKSISLRIGRRHTNDCQNLVIPIDGNSFDWESSIRYLRVYIDCAVHFRCLYEVVKRKFYCSFNGIYGKIGRKA